MTGFRDVFFIMSSSQPLLMAVTHRAQGVASRLRQGVVSRNRLSLPTHIHGD